MICKKTESLCCTSEPKLCIYLITKRTYFHNCAQSFSLPSKLVKQNVEHLGATKQNLQLLLKSRESLHETPGGLFTTRSQPSSQLRSPAWGPAWPSAHLHFPLHHWLLCFSHRARGLVVAPPPCELDPGLPASTSDVLGPEQRGGAPPHASYVISYH